jgi:hypothetical protein
MNPLSSTHTSGAAAASVVRASVDMFDYASVSSPAVSAAEAPHTEVSARIPSLHTFIASSPLG